MSAAVENNQRKEKCQVFTPPDIVDEMLDLVGYTLDLYGKKILESSCGEGNFLKRIVERYIRSCEDAGFDKQSIRHGLQEDVFGIELDEKLYNTCISSLNKIAREHSINSVKWSIFNRDALLEPVDMKFDFVVGNPPYISYWDMERDTRSFLRDKYDSCTYGAFDYFYAFLEQGVEQLSPTGKLCYIVANSFFKTRSGETLRSILRPHLKEVHDYPTSQLFHTILTSPAIVVIDAAQQDNLIQYYDESKQTKKSVKRESLGKLWVFGEQEKAILSKNTCRFGDHFNVSLGIATQLNRAFVLSNEWQRDGDYLKNGEFSIEFATVKKAASPKGKRANKTEYIILPYELGKGAIAKYDESRYEETFPLAYRHLLRFKDALLERDADKTAQWFEYGRSQALGHIWTKKLLLSTLITDKVRVYDLAEDEVPYSGLYITEKEQGQMSLAQGKKVLESEAFLEYSRIVGINVSGRSIRVRPQDILDYQWDSVS